MSISLAALELLSGLAKVRHAALVCSGPFSQGGCSPAWVKVMPQNRFLWQSLSAAILLGNEKETALLIQVIFSQCKCTVAQRTDTWPGNAFWLKLLLYLFPPSFSSWK